MFAAALSGALCTTLALFACFCLSGGRFLRAAVLLSLLGALVAF